MTVTITYEGLLQKTASWWAANGIDGDSVGPAPGSGDPYDAEDAIATLARLDCNLASELNVDALSQSSGLAVDDLIATAYYDGAGSTTSYAHATGGLPPESQAQAVHRRPRHLQPGRHGRERRGWPGGHNHDRARGLDARAPTAF